MATIHIDNQPYQLEAGANLLQAGLTLGFDIPYFCWHPALGAVGACRQCAIKQFKDAEDTKGRIVMACLTPVEEGMRISIDDPEVRNARAGVIEYLMENHPHDCPVCDEGGECHLQDMTVMTGHTRRRYRFAKRTFRNQNLGPFINHEMNRCITCYRCVRFYRDYAGGRDFHAMASRNRVYFGRSREGTLENEFSGNLVEICPTGVFTDKTFQAHYVRKWDLQTAPSVCVHCGTGCNTQPGARDGKLRRILNRYNGEVNGYFLCDRGRFGYGFVNSAKRLRQVMRKKGGELIPLSRTVALALLAEQCDGKEYVIGIGSPRASLEANFALREMVGQDHFYNGMSQSESSLVALVLEILSRCPVRSPSLRDMEQADAVLVLGEDVLNTAPRIALSLRQAVRNAQFAMADACKVPRWHDEGVRNAAQKVCSPLFIATPCATGLDDAATESFNAAPEDLARLGFAVAHALSPGAPQVPGIGKEMAALAARIADSLRTARRPLVVSGTGCGSADVIRAAANIAMALGKSDRPAELSLVVPECNSLGLAMLGAPGIDSALEAMAAGRVQSVVILENDLYRRANRDQVDRALKGVRQSIVIDSLIHETAAQADWLLPSGTFAESSGTLVNQEGRAQRYFRACAADEPIKENWRWMAEWIKTCGRDNNWTRLDDVTAACAAAFPALRGIVEAAPSADFTAAGEKIVRQTQRYSGRTALSVQIDIHEQKPPNDPDSPLAFSMEGYYGRMPAALMPFYWAPGWNSVQALNKFQDEVGGPMAGGDAGVRVVETKKCAPVYFEKIPPAFRRRPDELLFFPLHYIFGSDETSRLAPAVAERIPEARLMLNPVDAAAFNCSGGEWAEIRLPSGQYRLPVQVRKDIPAGMAGWPRLDGLMDVELPAWGKIGRALQR